MFKGKILRNSGKSESKSALDSNSSQQPQSFSVEWSFEDDIEKIVLKPLDELPVYTDLFRLAPRIEVVRVEANVNNADRTGGGTGTLANESRNGVVGEQSSAEPILSGEQGRFDVFFKPSVRREEKYVASTWGELPYEGRVVLTKNAQTGEVTVSLFYLERIEVVSVTKSLVVSVQDSTRYFCLVPATVENEPHKCANCDDDVTTADYCCKDCSEYYCTMCESVLHRRRDSRMHRRTLVSCVGVAFHSRQAAKTFVSALSDPRVLDELLNKQIEVRNVGRQSVMVTVTKSAVDKKASTAATAGAGAGAGGDEKGTGNDSEISANAAQETFVARMMDLVTLLEEPPESVSRVRDFLHGQLLNHTSKAPEMALVVREMVSILGPSSVTAGVLKGVHQRIVLCAAFHLKKQVMQGIFTSDVRTKEGWRILIEVLPDTIRVTHKRREQSIAASPEDQQFFFEYDIALVFDRRAENLFASSLTISKLEFGPKASPTFRQMLNARLGGGHLKIQ